MKHCGWLVGVFALQLSATAQALPRPAQKEARFLRLDESPELVLLKTYRRPQGRRSPRSSRYLDGRFGHWYRRQWFTLDWPDNPALAAYSPGQDACFERLAQQSQGFPYVQSSEHWFYSRYASDLRLDDRFLSPWLKGLDPHLASWLLRRSGCHRSYCSAMTGFPAQVFFELWNKLVPRAYPTPAWKCRERPVRVMSMGNEQKQLVLIPCDGSAPLATLQAVSNLARLKSAKSAKEPWPAEPMQGHPGEWQPGVRLLHPRLLWLLHTIADTYRWRAIYIYSGYRRRPGRTPKSHRSMHHVGRALDIHVQGVDNKHVLRACNGQPDTGCGYYPNGKFVHIDVRPEGSGRAVWVDSSGPGEPSRYVANWPGVYENGRVVSALRPKKKKAEN